MKKFEEEKRKVVPFLNLFNYISARDLEEIMEWLEDNDHLTDKGKAFRRWFWELLIREG